MTAPVKPLPPYESPLDLLTERLARWRLWLFTSLAALYLAGFTGEWRIGDDSALYLVLARSLAEGEGYRFGGEWHRFGYPGLPLLLAPLYRVFGEAARDAATWVIFVTAALTLAMTFRLFRLRAGVGVATAMVLLLGVCENFYRYAFQARNDMPFLLGVVAVLAGYEGLRIGRERGGRPVLNWGLVAGGLIFATFMRPVMLVLHLAVLTAAAWGIALGPKRAVHAGIGLASIGSLLLFRVTDPRRSAPAMLAGTTDETPLSREASSSSIDTSSVLVYESWLSNKLSSLPDTVAKGIGNYLVELSWGGILSESLFGIELGLGLLNALVALVLLTVGVLFARTRLLWGFLIASLVFQTVFRKPLERYLLPFVPLLLYAAWEVIRYLSSRIEKRFHPLVFAAGFGLLIGPNLVLCMAFVIEQRSTATWEIHDGGSYAGIALVSEMVNRHVPKDALLISSEVRLLTLLTERPGLTPEHAYRSWIEFGIEPHEAVPEEVWAALRIPLQEEARHFIESDRIEVSEQIWSTRGTIKAQEQLGAAPEGWRLVKLRVRPLVDDAPRN